jgi:hypothetical protein
MKKWVGYALVAGLALVGVVGIHAAGPPATEPLVYAARVATAAGVPLTGSHDVVLRLWDSATIGTNRCTTPAAGTVLDVDGRFTLVLTAECATAVRDHADLWVELTIDSIVYPRAKVAAMPYALEAGRASSAAGSLETRLVDLETVVNAVEATPFVFGAHIVNNGTASIAREYGGVITGVTRLSAGRVQVTFASGALATPPICTCTSQAPYQYCVSQGAATTSSIELTGADYAGQTMIDTSLSITCVAAR